MFGKKKTMLADADKKNDAYIAKNPVAANSENELMRTASKLMTSRKFAESIEVYKKLVDEYPEKSGLYEGQVGAGYYFLGDYTQAIEHYVSAMNHGGDKSMMDDNIWEASEALFKKNGDKAALQDYLKLFPTGNHKKNAEKLL